MSRPLRIGPAAVSQVYDVVGFVTPATGKAQFTLTDGDLNVTWSGGFDGSALRAASGAADLAACESCYLETNLTGMKRLQISTASAVQAGGLSLQSTVGRRVRWDLYLAD